METPTVNPPSIPPAGNPAATSVTPDERTASILARHQRGEKLTPSEGGVLGQFKKKLKAALGGAPVPSDPPARPVSPSPVVPVSPSPGSLPSVPPSPGLVRGTVKSLVESANEIAKRKLMRTAQSARANQQTLDALRGKEVIGEDRRTLIVNTSPEAFEAMGITDGKAVALAAFWGTLGLCGLDFWQALDELKELTRRNEAAVRKLDAAAAVTNRGAASPGATRLPVTDGAAETPA